jgi:hypothetical protein
MYSGQTMGYVVERLLAASETGAPPTFSMTDANLPSS